MGEKELQKLAQKIQLEIKKEELPTYLETFEYLEKLLTNFKKVRVGKKVKAMKRIDVGHLTLKDLTKLKKEFSQPRVSQKDREKNSLNTDDGFILFKK